MVIQSVSLRGTNCSASVEEGVAVQDLGAGGRQHCKLVASVGKHLSCHRSTYLVLNSFRYLYFSYGLGHFFKEKKEKKEKKS